MFLGGDIHDYHRHAPFNLLFFLLLNNESE